MSAPENLSIVVDWGTSNFRAYLVRDDGLCLERINTADGLNNVERRFADVLLQHIGNWLQQHGPLTTLLGGMVGSPAGWQLVPHLPSPVSLKQLAQYSQPLPEFTPCPAWIVPGVSGTGVAGSFDVMRGEELQYFGAQQWLKQQRRAPPQLLCFPGTHNKWLAFTENALGNFSTTMSGELFGLLSQQSILADSIDAHAVWNDDAFYRGIDHAEKSGGLLHHLFSVRSRNLNGEHSAREGLPYLSGLIIGHELLNLSAKPTRSIGIVGAHALAQHYQMALTYRGYEAFCVDSEAATILGALAIMPHLLN
ncbi:MAG: MFS transporter [Gammaproteobacteria bacterium]|nr:MFS transporter [Gammaproteobacteria bacterium]|tara:strand:- start:2925 stop:3848 length:924 start_codon:yes stop_codon:yes gene_type:complete